jgi:hypothetical protein
MIGLDAARVAELVRLPKDHLNSFMLPVGKQIQPAWDRGARLPDSQEGNLDRFPS